MKTVFLRALEATDKEPVLRTAIREPRAALGKQRFEVDTASFASMPRSPFAYWVSERLRRLFQELPPCETDGRTAKQGLATADDFRFVRSWWEVPPRRTGEQWFLFAKGGKFSPFYADVYLVVNWQDNGADIYGYPNAAVRNPEFYYRPGLTWPRRTKSELSLRVMPRNAIFSDKGPTIFVENDNKRHLLATLGMLSSSSFGALVKVQLAAADARPGGAAHSFEVGVIQSTPVPLPTHRDTETLASMAKRMWSLRRSLDTRMDTSHAFVLPALLQVEGDTLVARDNVWAEHVQAIETELAAIQIGIDERCFDLYGVDEADRRTIAEGFTTGADEPEQNRHRYRPG